MKERHFWGILCLLVLINLCFDIMLIGVLISKFYYHNETLVEFILFRKKSLRCDLAWRTKECLCGFRSKDRSPSWGSWAIWLLDLVELLLTLGMEVSTSPLSAQFFFFIVFPCSIKLIFITNMVVGWNGSDAFFFHLCWLRAGIIWSRSVAWVWVC